MATEIIEAAALGRMKVNNIIQRRLTATEFLRNRQKLKRKREFSLRVKGSLAYITFVPYDVPQLKVFDPDEKQQDTFRFGQLSREVVDASSRLVQDTPRLFGVSRFFPSQERQTNNTTWMAHCKDQLRMFDGFGNYIDLYTSLHSDMVKVDGMQGTKYNEFPKNPDDQREALSKLLGSLDREKNVEVLQKWLAVIAMEGISTADGILPDNHALEIFKRLLYINRDAALGVFANLIDNKQAPKLEAGLFQLSMLGAIKMSFITAKGSVSDETTRWVAEQAERLCDEDVSYEDKDTKFAVIASIATLYILVLPNNLNGAIVSNLLVEKCMAHITPTEERKSFMQFLVDSLSNLFKLTPIGNHLVKLICLSKFITRNTVLWPKGPLYEMMENTERLVDLMHRRTPSQRL